MMVASLPYLIGCWDHCQVTLFTGVDPARRHRGAAGRIDVGDALELSSWEWVLVLAALFTRRAKPERWWPSRC